ncbi:hypothetical protein [Candidatus Nitrosocosmicus arcticus]|uniref:DUF2127 domain-containing protein n=1 Tax=Candidatus Nitrosocosmicus arcticus TaxID=2035267 RepID=A0A557SSB5_9ARCH|nr:hypothetical protein [Candidatus Nitrosocosmicus arcticus]TVP39478.1 conserved membrane protein of unknown function [Candidatus Nitrosocosmicus arcticus]
MNSNTKRPIGVTIIAILTIIGGIALLIGGLGFIAFAGVLSVVSSEESSTEAANIAALGILPMILGVLMVVIGIIYLIVSYGLLKGKGWAWTITIIVTIIGIVIQIISAVSTGLLTSSLASGLATHIIGIIISGIIIFYLYRPHVRSYFKG